MDGSLAMSAQPMTAPLTKPAKPTKPMAVGMGMGTVATAAVFLLSSASVYAQPSAGRANELANDNDRELATISRSLDELKKRYGLATAPSVTKVERRLRQGEVHFLLKDYLRASVALLDVVDDPTQARHPKYDECVFLLAESLRLSRNFSGARRYYEQILERSSGERLKDVVLGLLEVAGATGRFKNVDRYIGYLRQANTLSRPDVDYIYGKMLFRTGDPDNVTRAFNIFKNIPARSSVSARGAYYAGVALVQLGRYPKAVEQFRTALTLVPAGEAGAQLRDLTHLSLGRLYQELGEVAKSADVYQEISQNSVYFPDMLYEVAWVQVTAANQATESEPQRRAYNRALRATELLMATAPGSRLYPQARILQGNLMIRLGAPENAYETFQTIIDDYGDARNELIGLLRSNDPRKFFDQLLAADLAQVEANPILPPLAINWALDEEQVTRAVGMQRDLADSETYMRESRELIDTLERALAGEHRYNMFPGLREARSQTIGTENRMLNVNRRLLNLERSLVFPALTEPEKAKLDLVHARVRDIEREVADLPVSTAQVESSRATLKNEFLEAGRQAHRLRYRVYGMKAQVVAVEKWYRDNGESLSVQERAMMDRRLASAREALAMVDAEQKRLEREIGNAAYLVDGDAGRTRSLRLRAQFDTVLAEERDLLRSYRPRVRREYQSVLTRIDGQRGQLDRFGQTLQVLQTNLDNRVQSKAEEMRMAVLAEVKKLAGYEQEQVQLANATRAMLGPVAQRTLNSVGEQFRNLVLKADVGIIDVAWARKQAQTEKVNNIIQEQQRAVRELEVEFADVLRE